MAAPKPIRMSSGMLSKTFRTIRAGVSRSRPARSCAKLAKSASFSTRAAAVMWRRGGRLSVGSTIQASIAKVGSASSLISGKGFLQPSLSSIRRMPPHRQRCRTPDTCNRQRSEQSYLARCWSRSKSWSLAAWTTSSRRFAGRAIPPMRHGNSSEASRGIGHDVAFDQDETKVRPRQ
jgi:hypothetical protein